MHIFFPRHSLYFFLLFGQFLYYTFFISLGVVCIATFFDYIQVMYGLSRGVLEEKFLAELFLFPLMWLLIFGVMVCLRYKFPMCLAIYTQIPSSHLGVMVPRNELS